MSDEKPKAKKTTTSKPRAKKTAGESKVESAGETAEKKSFQETMEPFIEKVQENFIGANYIDVFKKWNVLKGRASRKEFWLFALVNICIGIVLSILGAIPILGMLFGLVSFLFNLAILIPNFTVSVRRLHDTNRSGWTLLILLISFVGCMIFIPSIIAGVGLGLGFGYGFGFEYGYGGVGYGLGIALAILSFLLMLAGAIPILIFMILPGTKGENKYGPEPVDKA